MSRVIYFFPNFFFLLEKVIIDAINIIKTNKKNLKNKWRREQDKTRQCVIWSLQYNYVYRLYPNNLKV